MANLNQHSFLVHGETSAQSCSIPLTNSLDHTVYKNYWRVVKALESSACMNTRLFSLKLNVPDGIPLPSTDCNLLKTVFHKCRKFQR